MSEHGQQIANGIVDLVEAQPDGTYSLEFEISAPEDPQKEIDILGEDKHSGIKVFAAPVSKTTVKIDRAYAVAIRPTVNLFISYWLTESEPTRKQLNKLVDEIEESLREDIDAWTWEGAQTLTLYDSEQLRVQDRFFSVLSLSYFDLG